MQQRNERPTSTLLGHLSLSQAADLAKTAFQVHGADKHAKAGLRKQLKRKDVLSFFANLEP